VSKALSRMTKKKSVLVTTSYLRKKKKLSQEKHLKKISEQREIFEAALTLLTLKIHKALKAMN